MISYVEVPIGTGGLSSCRICSRTAEKPLPRPFAEIEADVRRAVAGPPSDGVALTGFEPYSHPDLPRIIGAARAHGAERVKLTTDGRVLDRGDNALGAFSAGVTHLELVLAAGDAATHDRFVGAPGAFESATSGARRFVLAAGQAAVLSGRVPLCRHTAEHAAGAVAAFAALGAIAVQLDCSGLTPTDDHSALLGATLETATVNRVAAWATGWKAPLPVAYATAPWSAFGVGA